MILVFTPVPYYRTSGKNHTLSVTIYKSLIIMFLFCVLISPNCTLFLCVLNLIFHISRAVDSINKEYV